MQMRQRRLIIEIFTKLKAQPYANIYQSFELLKKYKIEVYSTLV